MWLAWTPGCVESWKGRASSWRVPAFTPNTAVYCCMTGWGSTMCFGFRVTRGIVIPMIAYISWWNTKAQRLLQGSGFKALLLLRCCFKMVCAVAALRGCFSSPRRSVHYVALPPEQPFLTLCVRSYFLGPQKTWHKHAHTQMHRPWPSQKEELDVRLLLNRGCHKEDILRAWGTVWYIHGTAAAAEQKS